MKILDLLKLSLAASMVFSACDQSRADDNPDLRPLAQTPPSLCTAVPSNPECTAPGVITCDLPIYWGRPGSPTFPYSFQIQLATEGDPDTAPLGIMIPGGAGAP